MLVGLCTDVLVRLHTNVYFPWGSGTQINTESRALVREWLHFSVVCMRYSMLLCIFLMLFVHVRGAGAAFATTTTTAVGAVIVHAVGAVVDAVVAVDSHISACVCYLFVVLLYIGRSKANLQQYILCFGADSTYEAHRTLCVKWNFLSWDLVARQLPVR